MKKLRITAIALLTVALFTACDNQTDCYVVSNTINMAGTTSTSVTYMRGSEEEVNIAIEAVKAELQSTGVTDYQITKKRLRLSPVLPCEQPIVE